jgi:uncharacterized protein (UPF0332 family)
MNMDVRYKRPDTKNAMSILEAARKDMNFTLSMKPSAESGSTIVRNVHECFRMLGDALLVSKGIEAEDHVLPIKELMKLRVSTKRPTILLDNLRRLRHNVNYYGYQPNLAEVEDVISIAKNCFTPLLEAVRNEIEKRKM